MSKQEVAKTGVPTQVHKVTLSTGKQVFIREPKIKDREIAAVAAGPKGGDKPTVFMVMMQTEMLRALLVSVDGQELGAAQKENLDGLFTFREYNQLNIALQRIIGDEGDSSNFQIEG